MNEKKLMLLSPFKGTKYYGKIHEMNLNPISKNSYERVTSVVVMLPFSYMNNKKKVDWKQMNNRTWKSRTISETVTQNVKRNPNISNLNLLQKGFEEELQGTLGSWFTDEKTAKQVHSLVKFLKNKNIKSEEGYKYIKQFMKLKKAQAVRVSKSTKCDIKKNTKTFTRNHTEKNHHLSMLHWIDEKSDCKIIRNKKHLSKFEFELKFNKKLDYTKPYLVTIDSDPMVNYTKVGVFKFT